MIFETLTNSKQLDNYVSLVYDVGVVSLLDIVKHKLQ